MNIPYEISFQVEINRSQMLEMARAKIEELEKLSRKSSRYALIMSKLTNLCDLEEFRVYGKIRRLRWLGESNGHLKYFRDNLEGLKSVHKDLLRFGKDQVYIGSSDWKKFETLVKTDFDQGIVRFQIARIKSVISEIRTLRQQPDNAEREKAIEEVHRELGKLGTNEFRTEAKWDNGSIKVEISPSSSQQEKTFLDYLAVFFGVCFIAYMVFYFVGK